MMKNMNKKKKETKHICKFTKTCKTLDILYPSESKTSKIKRAIREFFLISEANGRKCFTPLGTTGYIAEKEKQLSQQLHLIHPYSKFRECWETFAIIEICLSFYIRTLVACDCTDVIWGDPIYQFSALFADSFETADIFLLFFTGFIDKESGNVVFNTKKIFFHRILDIYLVLNVIGSLPLEFIFCMWYNLSEVNTNSNMKVIVFVKIMKLHTCNRYLTHIAKIRNWSELTTVLIWGIFINFFICHWLTSVYHEISCCSKELEYEYHDFFHHYCEIFYAILSILLNKNVLISDKSSFSFSDNFFWFFASITLYFCSIISFGLVIHYLGLLRNSKMFYNEMKQEVQKFLIQENLPKHIHKKVMKYLKFRYRNRYFVEEAILKTLSPPLRREVASFLCMDLLINPKSIFNETPTDLAEELCLLMTYEIFLPGDVLYRAGDKAIKIYFLYTGSVAVYSETGKEVMHWYDQQQFGVSSLIPNALQPTTIIALEMSECYILRYNDFLKCASEYPEYIKLVTKAAAQRRRFVLKLYSEE